MFNDYKSKYDEFDKAIKKSRATFKKYEEEIKNMNKRIQQLEKQKKDVAKEQSKKGNNV